MNRSGQIKRDEFLRKLADWHDLYVRLALLKLDDGWHLHSMVVDYKWPSNVPPPFEWTDPMLFNYGDIGFVQGKIDGKQISAWIAGSKGSIRAANIQFQIPNIPENAVFQYLRLPSHSGSLFRSMPWAHTLVSCYLNSLPMLVNGDLLVSRTLPSFPSIRSAFYYYLHDEEEPEPSNDPTAVRGLFFREAHQAWIKEVRIKLSSVKVTVDGHRTDLRVEVGSPPSMLEKKLNQINSVRFKFKGGLPPKLWVVLSANGEWLDYRSRLEPSWTPFVKSQNGVLLESPDLKTSIEHWRLSGERQDVEFKERRPDSHATDSEKLSFIKSFGAMANGKGGVILVGINKDGDIVGLNGNVADEKDAISNMVRDQIFPEPNVQLEIEDINRKKVIAAFVEEGKSKPYGVRNGKYYNYYVRHNATTYLARPDEVRFIACEGESGFYGSGVAHMMF